MTIHTTKSAETIKQKHRITCIECMDLRSVQSNLTEKYRTAEGKDVDYPRKYRILIDNYGDYSKLEIITLAKNRRQAIYAGRRYIKLWNIRGRVEMVEELKE